MKVADGFFNQMNEEAPVSYDSLVIVTEAAKLGFGYNRSGSEHSSLKSEIMKYKTSECGGSSSEENYNNHNNRSNRKRNKGAKDSDESESSESDDDDSESGEKKKKGNRRTNKNSSRNNKKRNRQENDSNEYGSFPRYGMMDKRQNDYQYGRPESNPYQTTWNDRNHQYGSEYPNRQGSQNNFGYPNYPNRNPTNDYPNRNNFGNPMTPNNQYPNRPGYPNTPNRPGYPNSRPGYPNIDPYQPNGQRPYNRGQDPFQNRPYPNRGQEQFGNGQDQNRHGYSYGGDRPYQDRDDSGRNPNRNKWQQSDSDERGNPEHRRNGNNNNRGGGRRNKTNSGRGKKRPSQDESSEDDCVSQCVFNNMEIMEDDGIPSESAMIKWAQDKIKNDKLKGAGVKEIRKCFGTLASSDGDNSCNFSKSLAACLKLDLDEDK